MPSWSFLAGPTLLQAQFEKSKDKLPQPQSLPVKSHLDFASPCLQRPTATSSPVEESQDEVAASEVTEVQAAVDLVQKQMRIYDGSFLQFRCDEKGFLSICAFGLPGKTHEDSPARAIQVHMPPSLKKCFHVGQMFCVSELIE